MSRASIVGLILAGWTSTAQAVPPRSSHPLAAPGVEAQLKQAAAKVHKGDYASAEALLRELMPSAEDRERGAMRSLEVAVTMMETGDTDQGVQRLARLLEEFPDTQAATYAATLLDQHAVIGKPAPDLGVVRWLQGEAVWPWPGTTLVVFFEAWCPHCQREAPRLQAYADAFVLDGLQVVGLTRLTRGVGDADVLGLAQASGMTYPIAVEDGTASEAFAVVGVPAAALVRDGTIVWRGHPAQLDAEVLAGFLAAPTPSTLP